MRITYFSCFLLFIYVVILSGCAEQPPNKYSPAAVGAIMDSNQAILGTAFVLKDPYTVVCTYHQLVGYEEVTYYTADNKSYKLRIVQRLPADDFTLLGSDTPVCTDPLQPNEDLDLASGDFIQVISYDRTKSPADQTNFEHQKSIVSSLEAWGGAQAILFRANSIRGYSGSPVLNKKNEVVGLLVGVTIAADTSKKSKADVIAFSIQPILSHLR